ncbi:hypothetical protein GOBAR_DD22616 [Gossypium barbadense]|nr:hypothetical protein GOBAR_DD22616 [Gossypium barbadense]
MISRKPESSGQRSWFTCYYAKKPKKKWRPGLVAGELPVFPKVVYRPSCYSPEMRMSAKLYTLQQLCLRPSRSVVTPDYGCRSSLVRLYDYSPARFSVFGTGPVTVVGHTVTSRSGLSTDTLKVVSGPIPNPLKAVTNVILPNGIHSSTTNSRPMHLCQRRGEQTDSLYVPVLSGEGAASSSLERCGRETDVRLLWRYGVLSFLLDPVVDFCVARLPRKYSSGALRARSYRADLHFFGTFRLDRRDYDVSSLLVGRRL